MFHAATQLARSIRSQLGDRWDEFVYDPQSPDWVLDLAVRLCARQKPEQAYYSLLSSLAVSQPAIFDVHERLAELALELGLPRDTVLDHVERGRAAFKVQGDDVDREIQEEYADLFQGHLTRLAALARAMSGGEDAESGGILSQGK